MVVITSSVVKITFVLAEKIFKVAVISSSVVNGQFYCGYDHLFSRQDHFCSGLDYFQSGCDRFVNGQDNFCSG